MNASTKSTIAVGCDEAAFQVKESLRGYLEEQGHTVKDHGVCNTGPSLYPNIALGSAKVERIKEIERALAASKK